MNKYEILFEESPASIVNFKLNENNEPIIISANKKFLKTFTHNKKEKDIINTNLNKLIVPKSKKEESRLFDKRTNEGSKNHGIVERKTRNGLRKFAYRSISYNEKKGFAMYVDVTEKVQQNEHINVLNRIMRHNIRNELTVLMGLTKYVEQSVKDEDTKKRCKKLENSYQRLNRLSQESSTINNIIKNTDYLRIINIKTQIKTSLSECEINTNCVNVNIPSDIYVKAGTELYHAFSALIDNAIRYNDNPDPFVDIYIHKQTPEYVILHIKDNGPGINKQEKSVINENNTISTLNHGSGLGLWLSKWVVELYNGKIRIQNNIEGGGTIIQIKLYKD